jgi:excisionase family DNA binding protein
MLPLADPPRRISVGGCFHPIGLPMPQPPATQYNQVLAALGDRLLISAPRAANALSISKTELYRRLASGALHAVKHGHRTLVPVDALLEYIRSLPAYRA